MGAYGGYAPIKIDSAYLCWFIVLYHKPTQNMAELKDYKYYESKTPTSSFVIFTLNEDKYFELHETLVSQHEVKKFVSFASLLYEEILEMDWTDKVTDSFLFKCYVNTLHVTVAIIQQSIAEINRNGDDELKVTAIRALWTLHKMRVKLGRYFARACERSVICR